MSSEVNTENNGGIHFTGSPAKINPGSSVTNCASSNEDSEKQDTPKDPMEELLGGHDPNNYYRKVYFINFIKMCLISIILMYD